MKKALVLLCCVVLSGTFLFGCSFSNMLGCGGTTVDPILSDKPWASSTNYEYVSYGVKRHQINQVEGSNSFTYGEIEAEGTYTTTVVTIGGSIYESDELETIKARSAYFADNLADKNRGLLSTAPGAYTVLYSEYSLTYTSVNAAYAGKTDTISGVVLFRTSALTPAFSEKTQVSETTNLSYTAIADYANGVNRFTTDGNTSEVSITKDTSAFDNEMLYYAIRSSSSLTAGGGASLSVHNSVYTGIDGKESSRNIDFATNSALAEVGGIDENKDGFISRYFGDGEVTYYDEEVTENGQTLHYKGYAMPAYYVNMQLNAQNRGAVRSLFYSSSGFNYVGDTTSNVLMQIIDFETTADGAPSYATVSLINDYKLSRLM